MGAGYMVFSPESRVNEMPATVVGLQEAFDHLASRYVLKAADGQHFSARILDNRDNRDLVLDARRRVLDGFTIAEQAVIPNILRRLGEVNEPDLEMQGYATPLVSGISLFRLAQERTLGHGGALLLLYEGARMLEALEGLQENGKPLKMVVRSLDPRTVVVDRSRKVFFTSLDSVKFDASYRRAETEIVGLNVTTGWVPGKEPQTMADSVFLLGTLVLGGLAGEKRVREAKSEEKMREIVRELGLDVGLRNLFFEMLSWGERPTPAAILEQLEPMVERGENQILGWCSTLVEPELESAGLLHGHTVLIRDWRGVDPPRIPGGPSHTTAAARRKQAEKREQAAKELLKKEEDNRRARLERQTEMLMPEVEKGKQLREERKKVLKEVLRTAPSLLPPASPVISAPSTPAAAVPSPPLSSAPSPTPAVASSAVPLPSAAGSPPVTTPPASPRRTVNISPRSAPPTEVVAPPVARASTPPETEFLKNPDDYEEKKTELLPSAKTGEAPKPAEAPKTPRQAFHVREPSPETALLRGDWWDTKVTEVAVVLGVVAVMALTIGAYAAGTYLHWW